MRTISSVDARSRFGQLLDATKHAPYTVVRNGRPTAIVMSIDEYDRIVTTTSCRESISDSSQAGFLFRVRKHFDLFITVIVSLLLGVASYLYIKWLYDEPSAILSGTTIIHSFLIFWLLASGVPLSFVALIFYRKWKSKSTNGFFRLAKVGGEMVLAVGLVTAAALALIDYRLGNILAIRNRLEDFDLKISETYVTNKNLASVYLQLGTEPGKILEEAERILRISAGGRFLPLMGRYSSRKRKEMSLIALLSCDMWQSATFYQYINLIPAYFLAEQHLYLMYQAWKAYEKNGVIDKEDLENYAAYLGEVGLNPLFLVALHEAQRWKYIDVKFSMYLQKELLSGDGNRAILTEIFPKLTNEDDWEALREEGEKVCDAM